MQIGQTSETEPDSVAHQVRQFLDAPRAPEEEKRSRPRQRRPREVSGHDEASLSWFFGQGLSIYDKSTFGPIVDKIQLDGFSSTTCARCEGAGIIEGEGGVTLEDKCQSCDGSGLHPRKAGESQKWCLTCDGLGRVVPYEIELPGGGWCPSCKGTGSGSVERQSIRAPRCRWCKPEPLEPTLSLTEEQVSEIRTSTERVRELAEQHGVTRQTVWNIQKGKHRVKPYLLAPMQTAWVPQHCCPNCLGTGDEPRTAERMHKDDEGGGVLGNDTALTRFAVTSRRADRVKAISPALHAALEAFYGDVGNRWARTPFGRLFALFHLTPAGKKLARIAAPNDVGNAGKKKPNKKKSKTARVEEALAAVELNAQERIGVQANLQKSQPKEDRKKLLDKAAEQASDLYTRAARAWNKVATSKADKDTSKRLDENLKRLGHTDVARAVRLLSGGAP